MDRTMTARLFIAQIIERRVAWREGFAKGQALSLFVHTASGSSRWRRAIHKFVMGAVPPAP